MSLFLGWWERDGAKPRLVAVGMEPASVLAAGVLVTRWFRPPEAEEITYTPGRRAGRVIMRRKALMVRSWRRVLALFFGRNRFHRPGWGT